MSGRGAVSIGVWLEMGGADVEVGTAHVSSRREVVSTRFVYADTYLGRPDAFEISPDLPLASGGGTTEGLPGAVADSAPDRWGRSLIKKRMMSGGRVGDGRPRTVTEVDFLLGVSDLTRQGALRYRLGGSEFHAPGHAVPKLIELPRLLHAADVATAEGGDDQAAVQELLDAGSASLGGARPKASVRDGDRLFIAKFPHRSDEWDVIVWRSLFSSGRTMRCSIVATPAGTGGWSERAVGATVRPSGR